MVKKTVKIENSYGIHFYPARLFVQEVARHESQVFVEKKGVKGKGNSTEDLLILQIALGDKIIISAEGPDEEETLAALVKLIKSLKDEKYLKDDKSLTD